MDYEFITLNTQLRKNRIFKEEDDAVITVHYSQNDIIQLIPHRAPFLFLDTISKINLTEQKLAGTYYLNAENNVFAGHFPGNPIFPGVLQVEMMGQLGLCLSSFVLNNSINITDIKNPVKGVATRVRDASFMRSLLPNDTAFIEVFIYDSNEINGVIAGQIYNKENALCVTAILEVYYLE